MKFFFTITGIKYCKLITTGDFSRHSVVSGCILVGYLTLIARIATNYSEFTVEFSRTWMTFEHIIPVMGDIRTTFRISTTVQTSFALKPPSDVTLHVSRPSIGVVTSDWWLEISQMNETNC